MVDEAPWLLVGLGNPGPRYANNRHNVGFMAVETWCDAFVPRPVWSDKWKGRTTSVRLLGGARCVVLLPQTYMNNSGQSVGLATRYFRVPPQRLLVVHDEIDFPPGRLAVKRGGGHGGHNGLRDIVTHLGSREFLRLRLGVGRPAGKTEVSAHVLSDFSVAERQDVLPELLERAAQAISCVLKEGVAAAMNRYNQGLKKPKSKSKRTPPGPEPLEETTTHREPAPAAKPPGSDSAT